MRTIENKETPQPCELRELSYTNFNSNQHLNQRQEGLMELFIRIMDLKNGIRTLEKGSERVAIIHI